MNENEETMPISTVIGQLETLSRLIAVDGYGEHYVTALKAAVAVLSEAVPS